MISSLLNSDIFRSVWMAVTCSVTVYSIYFFIKSKSKIEHEFKELELHHCKHNCVVIFTGSTITGWPGFQEKFIITAKNVERAFEPICYFINTAAKSLDIAVMMIHSKLIMSEIVFALKRGVRIRLLLDYSCMYHADLSAVLQHGGEICYYKNLNDKYSSLFHYKYVVKDYASCEGYVLCGSANWNVTAFTQNYENLVFTSNHSVATAFHNNFKDAWDVIKKK